MKKSKFWEGLTPEQYSFIAGINEAVEDKTLIRPHTRYLIAATDYSDGISLRKLGVSSDGLGYGRLPYDLTSLYSGFARGLGIFQLAGQSKGFTTYFTEIFLGATPPHTSVSSWDQFAFASTTKTNIASYNGRSTAPVGIQLPCKIFANGVDALTDFMQFVGAWNIGGTTTPAQIIQQGIAPIAVSSSKKSFSFNINFGNLGSGNGQFVNPKGIAIDSLGYIYVVDNGNKRIQKFTSAGVYVSQFGNTGSPKLNSPTNIFIDSAGNFWVTDASGGLFEYDSTGTFVNEFVYFITGTPQVPVGIYVDAGGNIFVTYPNTGEIRKYNSSWTYQSSFTGSPSLVYPNAITVDGSGNFYVTDLTNNNVQKFNSSGAYQSEFGTTGTGNGQFQGPRGIAFNSTLNYLFVTSTSGNKVQFFDLAGTYLGNFGNDYLGQPWGVICDSSGQNAFVVGYSNQYVYEYSTNYLNGDYAYCYTLVDANGNESQPSPLATVDNLTNQTVDLTITPTGITQSVWTTIRIYRTLTSASHITASLNPTFYHVPGLDIAVTGAASYTTNDSTPDSIVEISYPLSVVPYFNGSLAALDVSAVPKFLVDWNNGLWGGFWNVLGVDNPIRVYYSATQDNSLTSSGNITSWNSNNWIDVGTLDDGVIIGLRPGLQGRLFVFKEFSTYVIQPTGLSSLPYSCLPISGGRGLYHHSMAEVESGVIGRAMDGIYLFNGSSYKLLSHPVYKTMNRLIQPEADSGIYDSAKQRYYLAVCDSSITNSYQSEVGAWNGASYTLTTSVINAFRNSVIIYDMNTGTWETHHYTAIQVFGRLKDTGGREKIFALGMSGDVFVLIDGNVQGATLSFLGTYLSANTVVGPTVSGVTTTPYANSQLFMPFFITSDGNIQFLDFQTIVRSTNVQSNKLDFVLNNNIPYNDSSVQMMVVISNAFDIVKSKSGNKLNLTNNIYLASCQNNYSLYDITTNTIYMWSDGGLSVSGSQQIQPINETFNPMPAIGDQIVIIPYRNFVNVVQQSGAYTPYHAFDTPPFGIRLNDMARKVFQEFRMQIKGSGTLYIYEFKDGNPTYALGPALCTPDATHTIQINSNPTTVMTDGNGVTYSNSYQHMVHLKGLVGYYMRIMIVMIRGTGWFEIQDETIYHRAQEELANV